MCSKWELIDLVNEDTQEINKLQKAESRLNKIISEINSSDNFSIVNQFGHYALASKLYEPKKLNQTQIIIERLKQGPASLNELVNAIYFFPLNDSKMDLNILQEQLKRIIRRITATAKQNITYKDNLYYLS